MTCIAMHIIKMPVAVKSDIGPGIQLTAEQVKIAQMQLTCLMNSLQYAE